MGFLLQLALILIVILVIVLYFAIKAIKKRNWKKAILILVGYIAFLVLAYSSLLYLITAM